MPVDSVFFEPLSPLRFLERSAEVFPDKIAIAGGDRDYSYKEFAEEATRLAQALRASGLRPGDRVAYLCPNIPEMLIAHFAVPLAGCVLVAINTRLSSNEVGFICRHSGASMLVVDHELLSVVDGVADPGEVKEVVVIGGASNEPGERSPARSTYKDLVSRGTLDPIPWAVKDEMDTISINYTSGTTGDPKGVAYSHRGAYLNALGEVLHSAMTPDSVYLWTLPMFHCNGWCTTWGVTAVGATHVCLRAVRPTEIWRAIDERAVTHLNAAPIVLTSIASAPEAHKLQRPLTVTTAGAAPSPTVIAEMEALGARVVHVYGLTEVYGPYSVCEWQPQWQQLDPPERAAKLARQGVGMLQAQRMRVVDEDMKDVPADGVTVGEIVMRGNNVMLGYFRDEEATESAFKGGWFHSGDLGVTHTDGYVELLDRAKDIVISGGENISTIEVENALLSHPAVMDVAVIGMPDDRWGERPKAFVVLAPERTAEESELISHVRTQIASFKAPEAVEFLEALPRTSTGKVQKFELREREWAAHRRRIQG